MSSGHYEYHRLMWTHMRRFPSLLKALRHSSILARPQQLRLPPFEGPCKKRTILVISHT